MARDNQIGWEDGSTQNLPTKTTLQTKSLTGILPVAKSSFDGWTLPGSGEAYPDCGQKRYRGCLNTECHPGGLDHAKGSAYIEVYIRKCCRAACPVCYESWAGREGERAAHRLKAYKMGEPIHLAVSVPVSDYGLDYEVLRSRAYRVSKRANFQGGCCIFHPWREDELTGSWYFSPHFHMVGYGWIKDTDQVFELYGWIVKNLGLRKSVSATLLYQLSHAGVNKAYHTVTWFGRLAYNKLRVDPLPPEKRLCPICKFELVPLLWCEEIANGLDPPEEVGPHFVDPDNWVQGPEFVWGS